MLIPLRKAVEITGLHPNTLRKYADNGIIKSKRFGKNRLFDVGSLKSIGQKSAVICYCRVSSQKQKDDLARQVVYMREQFPNAKIIKDIGSGLNFKRKGLNQILDECLSGVTITLVVAHRDRLCRFGFELIEYLINPVRYVVRSMVKPFQLINSRGNRHTHSAGAPTFLC